MGVPVLVRHDHGCRYAREADGGHSDAAKRVADIHNLHLVAGRSFIPNPGIGRVVAVALADGRSDGVLYDTRWDAVRHQHHSENRFAYMRIMPSEMTVCMAASFLRTHRLFFDAGWRLAGEDPRREVIPRVAAEEQRDQQAVLIAIVEGTR